MTAVFRVDLGTPRSPITRDPSGFSPLYEAGLEIWYRIPGGRRPDVLEIGLRGKRRPRVEAYWDGCIYAL